MVDIDPTEKEYSVRFKEKDKRQNQKDDKFEILRQVIGLRDTNNYLDLRKESDKTRLDEHKHNPNIAKDHSTIVDLNLYEIPSIHIKLRPDEVAKLRRHPDIRWVQEAGERRMDADIVPWGISRVGADRTFADATLHGGGYAVKVAMLDTGMDSTHTDLKANSKGGASFMPGFTKPDDDNTPTFHGTHTSGTVAAAFNNFGVVGVVPQAFLYAVKVLGGSAGAATSNSVAQGLVWANLNKMDVCNLSLSGSAASFNQDEADAIQLASNESRAIFCASGNNNIINGGKPETRYPAGYPGAWAVGAIDNTDTIANFSTYGPAGYVDFVGPGVAVTSTHPVNTTSTIDGTSMACPHLAGLYSLGLANYRFSPCDTVTYPPTQRKMIHIVGAMISSCDLLGIVAPGTQNVVYGFGLPIADKMTDILLGR